MSLKLSEQERLQDLFRAEYLGLSSRIDSLDIVDPFALRTKEDIEQPHLHILRLIRDPKYIGFTCKHIFNIAIPPIQITILQQLWLHKYPMFIGNRGLGKSFLLALYAMIRALVDQGYKIVIVGSAFRQAKVIFEYCETIWQNAPVLRDLVGSTDRRMGPRRDIDRCTMRIGDSLITALPLGDGTKIRGQRANIIMADEFATIPDDVFENVIKGFGAVNPDPIAKVKRAARKRVLQRIGKWSKKHEEEEASLNEGNQTIIAGTAYYGFNHFADRWKQYKSIIESRGDAHKLREIFGGTVNPKFSHKDFLIIRIPVDMLPEDFMDEKHVAHSQATMHSGQYAMEYGAVFAMDSNGFYKRSLIESCVAHERNMGNMLSEVSPFQARLRGDPKLKYIFAVDPASESDNFAITLLELNNNHRRIVYCWTTTRASHRERIKSGDIKEHDFYAYCARKIRDLMLVFPCIRIVMDAQGGGRQIAEALHDSDKLQLGELPIWEIEVPDEPRMDDGKAGLHILELVEFANAEWVNYANHGLKKDFETKVCLFPYFDSLSLFYANQDDKAHKRTFDTFEDVVMEIETLKDELASIVQTKTPNGRDRWDVPRLKGANEKKGPMRKDRYSALLMANASARKLMLTPQVTEYNGVAGGFANQIAKVGIKPLIPKLSPSAMYYSLDDQSQQIVAEINSFPLYGIAVRRGSSV